MRYNYEKVYINENVEEILARLGQHAYAQDWPKTANQVDAMYWSYDIGCSTDIALHWKHYNWTKVFDFFKNHPRAKATFATKYVNANLLDYQPEGKIRIRFSLMPPRISSILEPRTSTIAERVAGIVSFLEAGYEVHLNFSPIVVYQGWLEDYEALFEQINAAVPAEQRMGVQAECIFMTHNAQQHERNLAKGLVSSEKLLWVPAVQEAKRSQYGSQAVRYKHPLKAELIEQWLQLHQVVLPWNTVRYIF
jgi:spore photoproduct lyase